MKPDIDVSIIVPCRNEARFVSVLIERVLQQKGAGTHFSFELLMVDGRSEDETRSVIEKAAKGCLNIKIIDNPERITPTAFNLGIRSATGSFVCILGAHSIIARDYILVALNTIRNTGADNVGGPWRAVGHGYWGGAIAIAFQSPFSSGGAKSHNLSYRGLVDSVWGGFYKREVFERIGMFDAKLVRNQDDELNLRLVRSGGKIFQTPEISYEYICRDSLIKLWRQYYQYGFFKVYILRKHGKVAALRHLVPSLFVLSLIVLTVASIYSPICFGVLVVLVLGYLSAILIASIHSCLSCDRFKFFPVMPIVFAVFHLSYGIGFLVGAVSLGCQQTLPE